MCCYPEGQIWGWPEVLLVSCTLPGTRWLTTPPPWPLWPFVPLQGAWAAPRLHWDGGAGGSGLGTGG